MLLLVAEDESALARRIEKFLMGRGHTVDGVSTGPDAVWLARERSYDAIVLDVGLPGLSGFEVVKELRSKDVWTPVIMLTGRVDTRDRVEGLDSGADDYLTKPFAFEELEARLRAIARRGVRPRPSKLTIEDLSLDPAARRVVHRGRTVDLTRREFELLHILMKHTGRAVSRGELLNSLWDFAEEPASNVVDVVVHSLRAKLGGDVETSPIESVRGVGYRVRDEGDPGTGI